MTKEQIKEVELYCTEHRLCEGCSIEKECDLHETTLPPYMWPEKELESFYNEVFTKKVGVHDSEQSFDPVERPQHYASTSIECIDAMIETQGEEAVIDFCVCNAFKYLWRHRGKNGDEDVRKANWYLNKAVELMDKCEKPNEF